MKRKRPLTEFPPDFVFTPDLAAVFRKHNPTATDSDIAVQWDKFEAYHLSLGSEFKSWEAAWRTWCINSKLYGFKPAIPIRMDDRPHGRIGRASVPFCGTPVDRVEAKRMLHDLGKRLEGR